MNTQRIRAIGIAIASAILTIAAVLLLWGKLNVGLHRYFDADEFAYLHWAHAVSTGSVPIRDFLLYAPPGFVYVLAPVFFFWSGTVPLIAGRVLAWLIFAGIAGVLGGIFAELRGGKSGRHMAWLLPGIILALLPIPADKFMEIRPDNLAALFALFGIFMEIRAFKYGRVRAYFASGLSFAASLFVLPKTLPFVVVGIGVLILRYLFEDDTRADQKRGIGKWIAGFSVPCLVFLVWAIYAGGLTDGFSRIIYSLAVLPFEVGRIAERFGMQVDLFFYPNGIYYGQDGWGSVLFLNHLLWLFGIAVFSIRLVAPFIANGKKGVWAELLVAGSFFANVVFFIYGYPLRHAQYLIPAATGIAWFVADGLTVCARFLWAKKDGILGIPLLACVASAFLLISYQSYAAKMAMTNTDDIRFLNRVLAAIPRDAYVFDLVGSTLYYKDPYYVSAVPFGEWEPYVTRPLPPLIPALQSTGTTYIYAGKLGRVSSLPPEDRAYIEQHFRPMQGILEDMLVKQK